MNLVCRLLPHRADDGPSNMALDESLLESVAADPSMAIVRTYEWSTPTLSLGYFQKVAEVAADHRWASLPLVRRPTGGGALWHDLEITYAVVIPSLHSFARPSRALYQSIHEAIATELRSLGIPASRRGIGQFDPELEGQPRPFLCFNDRDQEDVIFRNSKLVGSAQRRRDGAVLQHGSLLLGRSSVTPELPGLSDLATITGPNETWVGLLRKTLVGTLGWPVVESEVSPQERERAEGLRRTIYADPSWTLRR